MEQALHSHCLRCHRRLKNPIFMKIGFGKVCLSKVNTIPLEEKTKLQEEMNRLLLQAKEEKKKNPKF